MRGPLGPFSLALQGRVAIITHVMVCPDSDVCQGPVLNRPRQTTLVFFLALLGPCIYPVRAQEPPFAQDLRPLPSGYRVTYAPLDPQGVQEWAQLSDSTWCLTLLGRTALWWALPDPKGDAVRHVDLQADHIAVFLSKAPAGPNHPQTEQRLWGLGVDTVDAVYLEGDVQMAEDGRSIRCEQLYYDLRARKALAVKAVLRTYSPQRGIPLYVRAERLRQKAQDTFVGEQVTLTSSEFHVPQVSFSAAQVLVVDTTGADAGRGDLSDRSFVAEMNGVRLKVYDHTLLRLPSLRTDLAGTDLPIRGVRVGYDDVWGASLETRWRLSRMLGLQAPEGADGTLLLDVYSERGPGAGVEIHYERDTYFGRVLAYGIYDSGTDTLGRIPARRDIEPPDEARGRFTVQHRQFLPRQWQLTGEVSTVSDRTFLEQYYRGEFNREKEQETLVHLKRIHGNQGFSLLAKGQINDFANTVTEMPGARFHWTGQSFLNDRLTFYSDTSVSRMQYRPDEDAGELDPNEVFVFMSSRQEVDLPLASQGHKVVPFAAVTAAYDDGTGFTADVDNNPVEGHAAAWFGEMGVRATLGPWWRTRPAVRSIFWDLDGLRHVVTPRGMAVSYWQTEPEARQRDVLSLGLSQRLQTRRGTGDRRRTVDWLEWNLDAVWLEDAADTGSPNALIWSEPFVPLLDRSGRRLPPVDRRTSTLFASVRDHLATDLRVHLTDSTAILADAYYDLRDGVVRQFNIGISHVRWPDFGYYIGSRYIRDFDNGLGERGTHAVTAAVTYRIDPRYTVVWSQQYDFDYGAGVRSALTLVRRYHRLNYGLTFGLDESMDEVSVVFGLWPQGVPELGAGLGRYLDPGR